MKIDRGTECLRNLNLPKYKTQLGFILLVLLATTVGWIAGCNKISQQFPRTANFKRKEWTKRQPGLKAMHQLARGNNIFAFDLYHQLSESETGNLVFSPYSISSGLAMVYGGSTGTSKEQIAKVLHFNLEEPELHSAFADQEYRLEEVLTFSGAISLANSIWPDSGQRLSKEFRKLVVDYYNADIFPTDFSKPSKAAGAINSWTKANTHGAIPEVVSADQFDVSTKLVLVNALAMTLSWQVGESFSERSTKPAPFYINDSKSVEAKMMTQKGGYFATVGDGFSVIKMPFEVDISLLVLLPDEIEGLAELEKQLTVELLSDIRSNLESASIEIFLPRWIVKSRIDLKQNLEAMGLAELFERSSGVNGVLADEIPIQLSSLIHDVYIRANEEGVEAVATTAGEWMVGDFNPVPDQFVFRADHPFLFLIQDEETGAIYFMGRVTDPSEHGNQDARDAPAQR